MSELVTAATQERSVLEPAMDARAANLFQFNPTPVVDSAMERALSFAMQLPPGVRRGALVGELEAAIRSNSFEGQQECSIAGFACTLVTDLRSIERRASRSHPLAAKAIARRLRVPLTHIARPAGLPAADLVRSCRVVNEAIAETPRAQLLTVTVEHELGSEKYELLARLVEDHHKMRAEGGETSGSLTTQGDSPGHGRE
jgi:hypothetical protein